MSEITGDQVIERLLSICANNRLIPKEYYTVLETGFYFSEYLENPISVDINRPNRTDNQEFSILHYLIVDNNLPLLRRIVRNPQLNINQKTAMGSTALMLTSTGKPKWRACDIILSHKDININAQDNTGITALSFAVQVDQPSIVMRLLARKEIDLTIKNRWGDDVIDLASPAETESDKLILTYVSRKRSRDDKIRAARG